MLRCDLSDADQDHWIGIEGTSGQLVKIKTQKGEKWRFLKQICKSATYVPIVLFFPAILDTIVVALLFVTSTTLERSPIRRVHSSS